MKLLLWTLLLSASANCQARFWDVQRRIETGVFISAITVDGWATQLEITHGAHERNPLAAPFVTHGIAGQAASSALGLAAGVLPSYLLYRAGHRKLSRLWLHACVGGEVVNSVLMAHKASAFF